MHFSPLTESAEAWFAANGFRLGISNAGPNDLTHWAERPKLHINGAMPPDTPPDDAWNHLAVFAAKHVTAGTRGTVNGRLYWTVRNGQGIVAKSTEEEAMQEDCLKRTEAGEVVTIQRELA